MSERPRLPAALVIGLGLELVSIAIALVLRLAKLDEAGLRLQLADNGIMVASDLILMCGAFVLARRLTGTAAAGARLVGSLLIARLVIGILWTILETYINVRRAPHGFDLVVTASGWIYCALALGIAAGFIVAAGGFAYRIALAIPMTILVVLGSVPDTLTAKLFTVVGDGTLLRLLVRLAVAVLAVVLGLLAARDAPEIVAQDAAANGLRLAASGLWLRIVAAVGIAGFTMMLVAGGSRNGEGVLKVVMLAGQLVNILAFVRFGLGALNTAGSDEPDLPRYPFAIGGTLSLWCAGIMLVQAPWLVEMLYGDHGSYASQSAQLFSVVVPLVAATSVVFVVIGISGVASRRGLSSISDSAGSRGAAFVALTLATVAIQSLILPSVGTLQGLVVASLAIAVAGFIAIVQIAKLCGSAADQLGLSPSLPKAIARLNDPP